MGLLDRWIKRKTEEQLNKDVVVKPAEKKAVASSVPTPPKASSTPKKVIVAEEKAKKSPSLSGVGPEFAREIIIRPLTTEKTTYLESESKYVFLVARYSTKGQIKRAIKELYQVSPLAVQVINVQGKKVRFGRVEGHRSDYKKAIITLPKQSTLKIHETV